MTSSGTQWQPAHDGSTLGMSGSAGGIISRDEECGGCRLTLEQDESRGFYALTCGISGWLVHTRYFGDVTEAHAAFDEMKPALAQLGAQLPADGPKNMPNAARTGGPLLAAFVARFP
jgi:hypothetical protein